MSRIPLCVVPRAGWEHSAERPPPHAQLSEFPLGNRGLAKPDGLFLLRSGSACRRAPSCARGVDRDADGGGGDLGRGSDRSAGDGGGEAALQAEGERGQACEQGEARPEDEHGHDHATLHQQTGPHHVARVVTKAVLRP